MNPMAMAVAVLHYLRQLDTPSSCADQDADFENARRRLSGLDVQVDDA